jgi:hypothetical protein
MAFSPVLLVSVGYLECLLRWRPTCFGTGRPKRSTGIVTPAVGNSGRIGSIFLDLLVSPIGTRDAQSGRAVIDEIRAIMTRSDAERSGFFATQLNCVSYHAPSEVCAPGSRRKRPRSVRSTRGRRRACAACSRQQCATVPPRSRDQFGWRRFTRVAMSITRGFPA